MNISPDKKWIELDLEESLFYDQTRARDEPYAEVLEDSDLVRIPYTLRWKNKIDEFNRTRGNET